MPRRKKARRRQWTPRPSVWRVDPPDELDTFVDALDIEDELDELEMLLDDEPGLPRHPGQRPVRARRTDLVGSPLAQAWGARAGDCGAGVARLARGLDYVVSNAVLDLQVLPGQLAAVVEGTRRYRVVVDILLPPKADMRAALERVQHVRAAALPGTEPRIAVQQAIVAGGNHLFPSPSQLGSECTCPDGAPCKHVVATVLGFGILLSGEPDLLFALWGFPAEEVRATPAFVLPPLAADRQPLVDDLGAVFGIDFLDPGGPATPTDAEAPANDSPTVTAPEPAPPSVDGDVIPGPTAPAPDLLTAPPSQQAEVGRDYLRVLGVSTRTIDAWLRTGVLRRTDRKDIYERTPEANRKIASFLAR